MQASKLYKTRNYSMFVSSKTNRVLEIEALRPEHVRLYESMKKYGFIQSMPITVRVVDGKYVVEDGQHRLFFASKLQIDVYYVAITQSIDVSELNRTQAVWRIRDYTNRWAAEGNQEYIRAHEFARHYDIPISEAFSVLSLSAFSNISRSVKDGTWKARDFDSASSIAQVYKDVTACPGVGKHGNLFKAIYMCCFVHYFEPMRLTESISKRSAAWGNGGTTNDFLEQIEEFYNFSRKTKVPLKFDAQEAMRMRNAAGRHKAAALV